MRGPPGSKENLDLDCFACFPFVAIPQTLPPPAPRPVHVPRLWYILPGDPGSAAKNSQLSGRCTTTDNQKIVWSWSAAKEGPEAGRVRRESELFPGNRCYCIWLTCLVVLSRWGWAKDNIRTDSGCAGRDCWFHLRGPGLRFQL